MHQLLQRYAVVVAAISIAFSWSYGGFYMADSQRAITEVERLLSTLNSENIDPDVLEAGLPKFSTESKNEIVRRTARTFEPAPSGKLLARLPFILTEQNRPDMTIAFIANLRSPDPAARKFSLHGLNRLQHAALSDFALLLLRDTDDQVLYAACFILLPKAKQNAGLWSTLQNLYAARKGKKEFYMSMSLLEAHGIDRPVAAQNEFSWKLLIWRCVSGGT
ncbi:MAG: hypothetical protein WKF84_20325 [Pyrinomonadaceae bacterium]